MTRGEEPHEILLEFKGAATGVARQFRRTVTMRPDQTSMEIDAFAWPGSRREHAHECFSVHDVQG
jgi:hypothetical protein